MKCPACNSSLLMTERQGIEIDYCPECRGVWLDRGELDKIVQKSSFASTPEIYQREPRQEERSNVDGHDNHHDSYFDPRTGRKKRKEGPLGFFGELFD
ncbi:MAG: hypothetical protein HGB22_03510 [Chlorobiaceae bacterium]|nr:hypothetical protein [Chlorobiaceae bacterium]